MAISIPDFTNVITFNGWNIVPMPTTPGFRSVEFAVSDTVAQVAQPFTQQSQFQAWPGGDWWEGTITLPKMSRVNAAQWLAFLMACKGMANTFLIGDPNAAVAQGLAKGIPVVDSSISTNNAPMTSALLTRGWQTSSFRLLLPGDYIQIGYRMHVVLNTVNSSSTGTATIQVYPSLREQPTDATPVILNKPKGLFRLASNKRNWSVDETRLFGLSFKIVEAK